MNRHQPYPLTVSSAPQAIRAGPGGGAAVLLVTHNPDLARAADRVLHLADGRLVPTVP